MWYGLRASPSVESDSILSMTEFLQSTLRNLIVTAGGAYLVWHVVATVTWPQKVGWDTWLITPAVVTICAVTLRLLQRHLMAAYVVWQIGLAAAILLAAYIFEQPEIAFLYALLPLMAVVTMGGLAGLLTQVAVSGLVWWFTQGVILPALPFSHCVGIIVFGAFGGLLGWAAAHALLTAIRWYVASCDQAGENMEEARQHRAQLARLVADLDRAYYRLERANAALVAAWKAADEAERFKAEFVTNVSHELRTPLNLIVGFSEVMMTSPESYDGVQLPGPYRTDLNAIYQSAQHLLALVDDVLDLARIEAGKISLAQEEVDLVKLVAETTEIVQDYILAKGLELRVHIDPELPALWIDPLRIRQVFLNLLVNAARFTERGWISLEAQRQSQGEILVKVTDTGRGIPEQDLPQIFEEFRSIEQPLSAWHSGTGLGLPICKKYVELHGGEMGVESTHLQGSSFWFTLPCEPILDSRRKVLPTHSTEPTVRPHPSERFIVVVHDDDEIAPLLQRHLDGFRAVGAPDMTAGATLVEETKAVALVTDASSTPGALPDGTPVVSCPLPSGRRAAEALGALDLLVKPVSRRDLLAAIDGIGRPVQRVLIADDDPTVVRLFRRMLRSHIRGQDCLEAYNGEEALRLIEAKAPDLVLLDLVMPGIDGQKVLEQMAANEEWSTIPVIIVSARAQDQLSLRLRGPVQVSKSDGFQLGEVVGVLEGILNSLVPHWRPSDATGQ